MLSPLQLKQEMGSIVTKLIHNYTDGSGDNLQEAWDYVQAQVRGHAHGPLGACGPGRARQTEAGGVTVCLLGSGAPEQPLFLPDPRLPPQLFAQGPRAQRLIQDSQHSPHPWPERWGQSSTRSSQARLGVPPGGNCVSRLRGYTGPREVRLWGGGVGTFQGEKNVLFKF